MKRRSKAAQKQKIRRDHMRRYGVIEETVLMLEEDKEYIRGLAMDRILAEVGESYKCKRPPGRLWPGETRAWKGRRYVSKNQS